MTMSHLNDSNQGSLAIGARIQTQRSAVGMTVSKLASILGVSRNTVTNYEKGNVEAVLDGAIDDFIREYVWQRSTGKPSASPA